GVCEKKYNQLRSKQQQDCLTSQHTRSYTSVYTNKQFCLSSRPSARPRAGQWPLRTPHIRMRAHTEACMQTHTHARTHTHTHTRPHTHTCAHTAAHFHTSSMRVEDRLSTHINTHTHTHTHTHNR